MLSVSLIFNTLLIAKCYFTYDWAAKIYQYTPNAHFCHYLFQTFHTCFYHRVLEKQETPTSGDFGHFKYVSYVMQLNGTKGGLNFKGSCYLTYWLELTTPISSFGGGAKFYSLIHPITQRISCETVFFTWKEQKAFVYVYEAKNTRPLHTRWANMSLTSPTQTGPHIQSVMLVVRLLKDNSLHLCAGTIEDVTQHIVSIPRQIEVIYGSLLLSHSWQHGHTPCSNQG